jgi:uncharacterized protein
MELVHRNIEQKIERLLEIFPCVALIGARQTGKTVLSKMIRPTWKYLDLERPDDYQLLSNDPILYFQQFPSHIIFDEAQSYPELFRILRSVVDQNRTEKGRFILTGSSSPELLKNVSETLSGRIAIIEIGTLKANEYYEQPLSDFYQLFTQKLEKSNFILEKQFLTNQQLRTVWLKGGYPEAVLAFDNLEYQFWMENYRGTYINRDVARLFHRLDRNKYQRFISMLAKLSGTIINKSEVGRALEFNESTAREYLYIADKTFIWREILSYEKTSVRSIVKMPKGHIRDSGLLHYLLRIQDIEDLLRDPSVGKSFESFVIEEILKGLEATFVTNWQPYYYRTRAGAEIDLLIEGSFGLLPIEIKYGSSVNRQNLETLSRFIEDNKLSYGIVINQAQEVVWLTHNIVQIPVAWL